MHSLPHALPLGLLLTATLHAALPTPSQVLSRMDSTASMFRSLTARIERHDFTLVLKESTTEKGNITLRQPKSGQVEMRIDFKEPDTKSISFANKKVQVYLPKLKTVQIYDVAKFDSLITQGLLIGFGTPGREVAQNYKVQVLAEENLQGRKTLHIELTPKKKEMLQHFKKLDLWLNEEGYPVQQKLTQNSGDYNLAIYTDMKLNAPLREDAVRLDLPKDVKKEFPLK